MNDAARAAQSIADDNKAILTKHGITFEKMVRELKQIGFSNQQDYFDVAVGGELSFKQFKGKGGISRQKAGAIKKIREKTVITESKDGKELYKTSTVELELYDKPGTLWGLIELMGNKPPDKSELTGPNGGPIEFSRLDRANRIAAIAELARKRKNKADKKGKNG